MQTCSRSLHPQVTELEAQLAALLEEITQLQSYLATVHAKCDLLLQSAAVGVSRRRDFSEGGWHAWRPGPTGPVAPTIRLAQFL